LGEFYYKQGVDKAVQAYDKAVELEPNNYSYQWHLGRYAYENQDYQLSVTAFQKAVDLKPDLPNAIFGLGLALVALGDGEEARQVYEDGLTATNALDDLERARKYYNEAISDLDAVDAESSLVNELKERLEEARGE
jgi:cytochrome c-type biogenesis protein CcmH/NrfG